MFKGYHIGTTIGIHSFPHCLPELRFRVRGEAAPASGKIQKDREISGGATAASNLATAYRACFVNA